MTPTISVSPSYAALGAESPPMWLDPIARAFDAPAVSLEAASRHLAGLVYETFPTTVLVRVFGTVPFARLPADTKARVQALAQTMALDDQLRAETLVFTLLGTRGRRASWNDRASSERHFGLPLFSPEFVAEIPMMSQLLDQIGLSARWVAAPGGARATGVFYAADAASTRDDEGRLVVPAQEFVREHDVTTVFGVGGTYPDDSLLALLCFTSEALSPAIPGRFLPVFTAFREATAPLVGRGKLFDR